MRSGRTTTMLLALLAAGVSLPVSVNARTKGVKALTDVEFEPTEEALRFEFVADGPLTTEQISAHRPEKRVISFRVRGTETKRRWLKFEDGLVKRTLLHPSNREEAAVLRIRLNEDITSGMLENVMVREEDGVLVVLMPRTEAIAARWAAPAPKAVLPPTVLEEEPALAEETAPEETVEADVEVAAEATAPEAPPAEPTGEQTLLALGDGDAAETPAEADTPLSAGVAQPTTEGPGMGVVAMSMFFLMVVGFLMWKRSRGQRSDGTGGPLIKPVGSHMLGPKQSLLLVDVAGEMVLLGTTDKGVQMLTKIQGAGEEAVAAAERATGSAVTPSANEVPLSALQREALGEDATPTPVVGLADRLGRAFARVRAAARGADKADDDVSSNDLERDFFARSREAVREAADEEAFEALMNAAENEPARVSLSETRAPEAPQPEIQQKTRPSAPNSADLLEKIRKLQSA